MQRRGSTPDQNIWAQVGAVPPDNRAAFNTNVAEHLWISSKLFEHRTAYQFGDVPFNNGTIREAKAKAEVPQRANLPDTQQAHSGSPLFYGCDGLWPFP